MDKLLREFRTNVKYHENAISHAKEKGMKLNDLNVFFQPQSWEILADMIENGTYHTKPTRICYLDKLNGNPLTYEQAIERNMKDVREIYVMDLLDRVVWNMFYQICYNRFCNWIHPLCKSYKKGESTRTTAKELSKQLSNMETYKGTKDDLSKYFDSVPIGIIDACLDEMEREEPSIIWKPIREFYHDNRVIINENEVERFGSLKQGCAFACLLADVILRDIDEVMAKRNVIYYRYSDDCIILGQGSEPVKARYELSKMLEAKGLKLNPKKTEYITHKTWFTFLGFRFKGSQVTISKKTLKRITHKVKSETIFKCKQLHRPLTKRELRKAIDNIQYYFFTGCEKSNSGMAGYLFGACNVEHDIMEIDTFIKDCIRAAYTNKCLIYGLGSSYGKYGIVPHNKGTNVTMNRIKTTDDGDLVKELGWYSLIHMYKKYHSGNGVYEAEKLKMQNGICID